MDDAAQQSPSGVLAEALSEVDLTTLDSWELTELVEAWEKIAGWVQASQNQVYAALNRIMERHPEPAAKGFSFETHSLGLRLGVSTATIETRMAQASVLVDTMPQVHAALLAGAITTNHARAAAQAVSNAGDVTTAAVDQIVMGSRRERWASPRQLEQQIARAINEIDPTGVKTRRKAAVKSRDVRFGNLPDGMGSMWSMLPVEDCQAMAARLDAEARASAAHPDSPDDHRTLAQRRADALVALVTGLRATHEHTTDYAKAAAAEKVSAREACAQESCTDQPFAAADKPSAREPSADESSVDEPSADEPSADEPSVDEPSVDEPSVNGPSVDEPSADGPSAAERTAAEPPVAGDGAGEIVTTGAAAAHNPDGPLSHGRRPVINVTVAWTTLMGLDDAPADLTGYGPIDAATARRIAADSTATWRRLLVEPQSGRLLDIGRRKYRPPADLAEYVLTRDQTCRYPICDRPAEVCDIDHRQRWRRDGRTADTNLDTLCRQHHKMKDKHGWHHERNPDTDASCWTTPRGDKARKLATRHPVESDIGPPPF